MFHKNRIQWRKKRLNFRAPIAELPNERHPNAQTLTVWQAPHRDFQSRAKSPDAVRDPFQRSEKYRSVIAAHCETSWSKRSTFAQKQRFRMPGKWLCGTSYFTKTAFPDAREMALWNIIFF